MYSNELHIKIGRFLKTQTHTDFGHDLVQIKCNPLGATPIVGRVYCVIYI